MTKNSDKKIADNIPVEVQIKDLEKTMGTIVRALKELKASVKVLEEKENRSQSDEIQEIVKSQKTLEEIITTNAIAIKRIDEEIKKCQTNKEKIESSKDETNKVENEEKKCRYFNRGHCKFKLECKFLHPTDICKTHLEGKKCNQNLCKMRHPKACKWSQKTSGCRRIGCDYLHDTLARDDVQQIQAHKSYSCAGCKNCYDDIICIVQHIVGNTSLYLCLNCENWIKKKEMIINPGWSLFDGNGDLRKDV